MKKRLAVEQKQEVLSLVTNITYTTVSDWFDATYRDLKMDLIIPKHKEAGMKRPRRMPDVPMCSIRTVSKNLF